jgi:hypothetical protein
VVGRRPGGREGLLEVFEDVAVWRSMFGAVIGKFSLVRACAGTPSRSRSRAGRRRAGSPTTNASL